MTILPFPESIRSAVDEYYGLGFDTLPLRSGTKDRPLLREWQRQDPYRMWLIAPEDANIGIRFGGDSQVACLECDERKAPGTFDNAQDLLFGLGIEPDNYPIVLSASGGSRHVFVRFTGGLPGNYRILSSEFGAGEFRYGPGSYSAAPPSRVEDGEYTLLGGDFRQLPTITRNDVLPIIHNQETTCGIAVPIPKIPRRTLALLHGKHVENYKTRSEAEQSIITSLINAGHAFDSVKQLFTKYPAAGKYAEIRENSEKDAIRWLHFSYKNALHWAQANESDARREIQEIINWALSTPWKGRTGSYDRSVLLAHATIAHLAGRLTYSASARDLGELAGCTYGTASNATRRLIVAKLIELITPAVADCANIYKLLGQTHTLPHISFVRKCISLTNHDAFRYGGLGKSAAEIYGCLLAESLTVSELSERTGRGKKTVKRALMRMQGLLDVVTGELIDMVAMDNDRWIALDVDLDHIAELVGTSGALARQQKKHRIERRLHRRALMLGRKNYSEDASNQEGTSGGSEEI